MSKLIKYVKKMPDKSGYIMILPFFIIYLYFWITPIFNVVADSFTDYQLFGGKHFVGLGNYIQLMKDVTFIKALGNTVLYTIGTVFPTMVIGFLAAQLMNSSIVRTKISRTIMFVPHVLSMVAVSMIWLLIYDPAYGHANFFLKALGITPLKWLQNPDTALISIIIMSIWKGIGYNMIINLAGLQNIPRSFYEVAQLDGANYAQKTWYIILPMMRPTTFFLLVTGMIGSFNVFEQVNIMTGGGPANATTTIIHQVYLNGFTYFNMGYASAQSVMLIIIVLIVTMVNFKINSQSSEYDMG